MLGDIIGAIGNIVGGVIGQKSQQKMAQQNIQLQKDFAQQGIRWKVADAQAAGIHPIYALGAPTHSFSPVSVGDSLGSGIARAGQNIGRAVNSASTLTERATATGEAMAALQVENQGLQNEMLKSQIARMRQTPNPPLPELGQLYGIPGQGQTAVPNISDKTERSGWNPSDPSMESHAIADTGWARSTDGTWALVPGKDVKNRVEDMSWYEAQHWFRNNVAPFFSDSGFQGPFPAPTGSRWVFNPITGKAWLEPLYGTGRFAMPGLRRDR